MTKGRIFRVRVKLAIESWVEVTADTPDAAERAAAALPGVITVFGRSAVRGDKLAAAPVLPAGVQEDLFE